MKSSADLRAKHQVLLDDTVRMEAYRQAITELVRPGDVVADFGCGLGALSFMALQAGAARVHAIDVEPETLRLAQEAATREGVGEQIIFHEGLAQTMRPPEHVDLIISETLGSFGLDENTLPLLLAGRRRWLKQQGRMCPYAITLTLVPTEESAANQELLVQPTAIHPAQCLAEPVTSPRIDFMKTKRADFIFRPRFRVTRSGHFTSLAGWFTVWLTETIYFSTAPDAPSTHWKQGLLPLHQPVPLSAGQSIDFIIGIGPDPSGLQSVIEFDFTVS